MFSINYWPTFYDKLLPKLDSLVNDYEKRHAAEEQEKWLACLQGSLSRDHEQVVTQIQFNLAHEYELLAAQREGIAKERQQLEAMQQEQIKCRKEQLSTFSLALIFYNDRMLSFKGLWTNVNR